MRGPDGTRQGRGRAPSPSTGAAAARRFRPPVPRGPAPAEPGSPGRTGHTAFLLMDLVRRGLGLHANAVLNAYVARTGDIDGLALLPLFLSCRAGVRTMTSATAASLQEPGGKRRELE